MGVPSGFNPRAASSSLEAGLNLLITGPPYDAAIVAPVSERFQFVPSEKAKIAEPAAPFETYTTVPAPAEEADGALATV